VAEPWLKSAVGHAIEQVMSAVVIDLPVPVLVTSRLRLRPYVAEDIDAMAAMFADPDVRAFTYLGRRDRAQTEKILDEYISFLAAHGWGMFAVFAKADGAYLGEAGLFVSPTQTIALRYALNKASWGNGYASEASAAVLDDAFGRMRLASVDAGVKEENKASVRVLQKLGFTYSEMVSAGGHTFGVYVLTADQWSAQKVKKEGG
jgi:ribosomal-protein-alanine N-acetyltransferase